MKKLLIIFILFSNVANAFNSGLNVELSYLYLFVIGIILLIIGIDKGVKYIRKKKQQTHIEPLD
ncbi:MAG: hypothetical protein WCO54_10095 [Bacteroidota bacterium]